MFTLKRALLVMLIVTLSGAGHPLFGQRGRGGVGLGINGLGPRLGENIQLALARKAELGLSAPQVASLQELQAQVLENVEPLAVQIDGMRAGIQKGDLDAYQGTATLQELLAEYEIVAGPYRAEVASILSTNQHAALQQMMWVTGGGAGLGLGRGGVGRGQGVGLGVGLGRGRGVGLGRGGGLGLGRGGGLGLGRGIGLSSGRGLAPGLGMGVGAVGSYGVGRGLGRAAGGGLGRRAIWR